MAAKQFHAFFAFAALMLLASSQSMAQTATVNIMSPVAQQAFQSGKTMPVKATISWPSGQTTPCNQVTVTIVNTKTLAQSSTPYAYSGGNGGTFSCSQTIPASVGIGSYFNVKVEAQYQPTNSGPQTLGSSSVYPIIITP